MKNLPAMQEIWVHSLDREDPLEEGTATHSSIRAWRTRWTEEPGGLQSMGSPRARHTEATEHARHAARSPLRDKDNTQRIYLHF